jgi:hypothetical protein
MAIFQAWHFNITSRIPELQAYTAILSASSKLGIEHNAKAKKLHSKCDTRVHTPPLILEGGQARLHAWFSSTHSANLAAETRLLSFNRMQSRVVTVLLTRHNTLRRHFYILELIDSPLCRSVGQGKKPHFTFCVHVKL